MLNVRRIPFCVGNNYIYKCHCPGHKRKRKGSCFRLLLYSQWVTTVFDLAELLPQMPFLTQTQWDLCLLPGDKKAKFGKKKNVLSLQLQDNQSGLITPYFSHPFIHFLNCFHGCLTQLSQGKRQSTLWRGHIRVVLILYGIDSTSCWKHSSCWSILTW